MPSILESVAGVLDIGEGWGRLGATVGGEEQARSALDVAGPVLIGGLADRIGQGDEGLEAVLALLDAADATIVDRGAEGVIDGGDAYGQAVVVGLFGEDRDELGDGLAERADVDAAGFAALLPKLAPVVTGVIEHLRQADELDDDGVAGLLGAEREALAADDDLGDWFTGLVATGGIAAVLAGIGAAGDDSATAVTDAPADDVAGAVGDDDETGDEVVAASEDDDVVAVSEDQAGDEAGDDVVAASEDDEEKPLAVVAAGAAAATAGKAAAGRKSADKVAAGKAAAGRTAVDAAGGGGDGSGRRGLGWLWWGAGAVILFVALALILSQLSSDEGDDTAADDPAEESSTGEVEVDEADGEATVDDDELATLVDAVLPEGVTATIDSGAVTLNGVAATEDEADVAVETVSAIDGVESVVSEIEVSGAADEDAEADADADAEADADADAEADAEADADADADAEVAALLGELTLPDGLTVAVADGAVTIGGAAASYAEVEAVVAAITEMLAGVDDYAIATEVEIGDDATTADDEDTAVAAPPAGPGTTLNDELQLAPITFRYLSGLVTQSGEETLDQVVAYLQSNEVSIEIQGHTDSDGSESDNQALSERRAGAVRDYLVEHGIPAERLTTVGFGESTPKVPNDSLQGKAENRRIEFVIVS